MTTTALAQQSTRFGQYELHHSIVYTTFLSPEVAAEYGLESGEICKLASNENPWGASPKALKAGADALSKVNLYPEGSGQVLRKALAKYHLC